MTLTQRILDALGKGATSGELARRFRHDQCAIASILTMKSKMGVVEVIGTRTLNCRPEFIYRRTGKPDAWPQKKREKPQQKVRVGVAGRIEIGRGLRWDAEWV